MLITGQDDTNAVCWTFSETRDHREQQASVMCVCSHFVLVSRVFFVSVKHLKDPSEDPFNLHTKNVSFPSIDFNRAPFSIYG